MFFNDALSYVEKMGYDLTLLLGNEIMFHNDIFDNITSGKCKKINNTQYVLVEFTPYVSDFDLKSALINLSRKGYKPILAHFERYECIAKSPSLLSDLKNAGILIQVNANSIVRPKLGKAGKLVKVALKKQLIDIVATDAHDDKALTPVLSKAHTFVVKKYGKDYAKKIFHDNQNSIINNLCIQQGE
jgi:protein-tyrosine phosphatase